MFDPTTVIWDCDRVGYSHTDVPARFNPAHGEPGWSWPPYCFDYSRDDIRRDIETTGKTSLLEDIKADRKQNERAAETLP